MTVLTSLIFNFNNYMCIGGSSFLKKGGGPKSKGKALAEGRMPEGGVRKEGVTPSVHARKI